MFRVYSFDLMFHGLYRVQGSGFRVCGLGFEVLGFRVQGLPQNSMAGVHQQLDRLSNMNQVAAIDSLPATKPDVVILQQLVVSVFHSSITDKRPEPVIHVLCSDFKYSGFAFGVSGFMTHGFINVFLGFRVQLRFRVLVQCLGDIQFQVQFYGSGFRFRAQVWSTQTVLHGLGLWCLDLWLRCFDLGLIPF